MKRVLFFCLIFLFPLIVLASIIGDVDGDGKISSSDYILIRKYLIGSQKLIDDSLKRADVNNDNVVTSADYILIRKKILENSVTTTVSPVVTTPTITATLKPNATPSPTPTATPTSKPTATPVSISSYVITEDSKFSSYKNVAAYDSSTLKYRIINYNGPDIVLVWIKDANMQLNGALASSNARGSASAEAILSSAIAKHGSNKGLVAINASFFEGGTPLGGVVINDGKVAKNVSQKNTQSQKQTIVVNGVEMTIDVPVSSSSSTSSEGISWAVIGVDKNGIMKMYNQQTAKALLNEGVRNTFVVSGVAFDDPSKEDLNRTQICQIDKNNFAIISTKGIISSCGQTLRRLTGCETVYNLDGGGSRKLYYKVGSGGLVKRFGGDRDIPDMLYFVEQ